jgi:UPF0716 protein FxsA
MPLLIAILALIMTEIALFILIGQAIGVWLTLAWVLAAGFLGVVVLKRIATLGPISVSQDMAEMTNPLSPIAHSGLVTIGGTLLIIPGFLTDLAGLALLVPPVRSLIIRLVARRFRARRAHHADRAGDTMIDGEWQDVTPGTAEPPGAPPAGSPPDRRSDSPWH